MSPVVITGVGSISSTGLGLAPLRAALESGSAKLTEVDRSAGYHRTDSARSALVVPALDTAQWLAPGAARRMSRPSRFAVIAAKMARDSAALTAEESAGDDVSITLATSFGATAFTERMLTQVFDDPQSTSPLLFMETVANAHAGQVALAMQARGSNTTITQREAGGVIALMHAADQVRRGTARVAFAGVTDELAPLTHSVLDRFGALSRGSGAMPECGRAFDRDRDGFVAAEGSTVFVLENEERARLRDAPILARIGQSARAFDPTATSSSWGRGSERLGQRLARLLDSCGGAAGVDRIVSGASGTVAGDRLEAQTLTQAWSGPSGSPVAPILAPKAVLGEFGGGFLASALLGLTANQFAPSAGFATSDPELALAPYAGGQLPPAERVLISSLAAGGAAAWLVLERP